LLFFKSRLTLFKYNTLIRLLNIYLINANERFKINMIKVTYQLIRKFLNRIRDNNIAAFSAQAALFIITSFFPFIMFILSLVQYFGSNLDIEASTMMTVFTQVFPDAFASLIIRIIEEVYNSSSGTIISVTAITTLWSAGKGFLAVMKGLNAVYDIKETRNYIFLRITSAIYTLALAIMLIATLVLFVFGNRLYLWTIQRFPVLHDLALVIISLRTIFGLIILVGFFLLIYVIVPNRKSKFAKELPGAILCATGWMAFSYAFSFYIDNFSSFSSTYGSLTAIVLFILWLYFCMYILFIGAEFNQFLDNKELVEKIKNLYR